MKLIKKMTLGAFLVVFASNTFAQDNSGSSFGIKGGLNYATVSKGDFDEGPDPRTSFHIGFMGEVPLVPKLLSLQPELLYSRQGFERHYPSTFISSSFTETYKIDYLNVPILAKLKLGNVFSIEAGPQFGMKVSEKVELDNGSSSSNENTNNINSFDTAIAGGISLNFTGGAFIFGRFTQSLNEVVKDSGSKNMVIQAGIGFKM